MTGDATTWTAPEVRRRFRRGMVLAAALAAASLVAQVLRFCTSSPRYWQSLAIGFQFVSLAVGVTTGILRDRRAKRIPAHTCRGCGYDLRAAELPGICPECGAHIARSRPGGAA